MRESPETNSNGLAPIDWERDVVERLKSGDTEAVGTLYGWYGEKLFRQVIIPRLPNQEAAEDCLRDTFKTALEKIASFTEHKTSIFFWLRTIAIRKSMDVHRKQKRDQKLLDKVKSSGAELTSHPPRPDRGLEIASTKEMVETSMTRINARYATALRLRLIEDRPRKECAEHLEVSVATFDVILHRACKAFRGEYPP